MELGTAHLTSLARDRRKALRGRPLIECGQCGASIYVAEWSEHLDPRHVRHLWECEACGYTFETTIRFAA
ncbi:MAG TPA: hypothetical protein VHV58_05055 [Pseudolabrys sp.]|jgi:ribosomal protein S27AE|nr:hypothetical protein [Pseudolabrys sp.]HEX3858948.1 hypothetical protein [Pseudolabrys sp.]